MADLKYKPVPHDHKAFLARARARKGFDEAYNALALEYQVASQMFKARSRAGLTQDAVAERMGTTKRAQSRASRRRASTPRRLQGSSGTRVPLAVSFKSSSCHKGRRDAQPFHRADVPKSAWGRLARHSCRMLSPVDLRLWYPLSAIRLVGRDTGGKMRRSFWCTDS